MWVHGTHRCLMCLDQVAQLRVMHRSVVEVSSQGQQDDQWAPGFRCSRHEQVNEALAFPFGYGLSEQFFKLVNREHNSGAWLFDQLACEQMQTARRVVLQVHSYGAQTPVGQSTCE